MKSNYESIIMQLSGSRYLPVEHFHQFTIINWNPFNTYSLCGISSSWSARAEQMRFCTINTPSNSAKNQLKCLRSIFVFISLAFIFTNFDRVFHLICIFYFFLLFFYVGFVWICGYATDTQWTIFNLLTQLSYYLFILLFNFAFLSWCKATNSLPNEFRIYFYFLTIFVFYFPFSFLYNFFLIMSSYRNG